MELVETVDGPELAAGASGGAPSRPAAPKPGLWLVHRESGAVTLLEAESVQGPQSGQGPLVAWANGRVVAAFAAGEWVFAVLADAFMRGQSQEATSGEGAPS